MILLVLIAMLFAMFLLNEEYYLRSQGMMRHYGLIGGACALGILAVPNGWLQMLLTIMLFNLLRDPLQGSHHARALPLYLLMFAGVVALQHLDRSAVYWLLLGMTGIGFYVAGICILEWIPNRYKPTALHGWQENQNNVQAITVLCLCAAIGMGWAYSPWWWLTVPVVAIPILITQYIAVRQQGFTLTMAPIILIGLGVMLLPLWFGWWAILATLPAGAGILWGIGQAFREERWWDSGRIRLWFHMLFIGWWRWGLSISEVATLITTGKNERGQPYSRHEQKQVLWSHRAFVRLFGRGWQSWMPFQDYLLQVATKSKQEREGSLTGKLSQSDVLQTEYFLSTAHNEYIQMLFEHGIVGFVALAGYILTGLWALGHGNAEAQAVYIVAVGVCGVAAALHPLSAYHNTYTDGTGVVYSIGSPALNWMSLMTAILVEVVR